MERGMKLVVAFGIFISLITISLSANFVFTGNAFLQGDFNNTLYNETGAFVHLNWSEPSNTTYVSEGIYTSEVLDLGYADFHSISWEGRVALDCPGNMSYIDKLGGFCIDQYEASRPDATSSNQGSSTAYAVSKPNVLPWVSVTQTAARTACINAGKHLCSSEEWLAAANIRGQVYYLPATLTECNVASSAVWATGSGGNCVSAEGVYDMVGNVWEWTNESGITAINPSGAGTTYWHYINSGTMQYSSSSAVDDGKYGKDGTYFASGNQTGQAVLRGGFWITGANAGPFAVSLNIGPTGSFTSIGFRCCSASI